MDTDDLKSLQRRLDELAEKVAKIDDEKVQAEILELTKQIAGKIPKSDF